MQLHETKNSHGRYLVALSVEDDELKITPIKKGKLKQAAIALLPGIKQSTRDHLIGTREKHTSYRL